MSAVLALIWAWVGVVYQWLYFSPINPAAKLFALAFLAQAVLFAMHAAIGPGVEFRPRIQVRTVMGATLISYAMVAYPLIGLLAGELSSDATVRHGTMSTANFHVRITGLGEARTLVALDCSVPTSSEEALSSSCRCRRIERCRSRLSWPC